MPAQTQSERAFREERQRAREQAFEAAAQARAAAARDAEARAQQAHAKAEQQAEEGARAERVFAGIPPRPPSVHQKSESKPSWQKFAEFASQCKEGAAAAGQDFAQFARAAAGGLPDDFRRFMNEARANLGTPRAGKRAASAQPGTRPKPEASPSPPKPKPAPAGPFGANAQTPRKEPPRTPRQEPPPHPSKDPPPEAKREPPPQPQPRPRPTARARCASADPRARTRSDADRQEQIFAAVRNEVRILRKVDPAKRKRELHKLFLRWHPDKNPHDMEFATKVFQHIQEELRRK